MSLVGIGLDLVELSRFRALYDPNDLDILGRAFTPGEIKDASASSNVIECLAGRFAAKEATLKVLGGIQQGTALTDVEIRSHLGAPTLTLHGMAAKRAEGMQVRSWHLSITHSENSAAAVVIASA